jgi:hypothetical protein
MKNVLKPAVLMLALWPMCAQAQQSPPQRGPATGGAKPTVADVQRVVGSISADKEKSQAYCEIVKLDDQIMQAEQRKDTKQAQELAGKADQVAQKLGPEYNALMANLQQVDPSSKEGQEMVAAFDPLEKMCSGK